MRKIYTLLLALVASMTAFAQNPDPSKWQKGQNVIADLGMKDVDPTEAWTTKSNGGTAGQEGNYGQYWKGVGQKFFFDYIDPNDAMYGDHEKGNTCMGYYGDGRVSGENPDVYQVVKFPAGYYTIRVQACYRDASGQQTTDCFNAWKKGQSKKNAWAYVETYADEASATEGAEPVRSFTKAIRHIFDIKCSESLCSWTPNGDDWRNDGSFIMIEQEINDRGKVVEVEKTYYYPRSIIGASYYFQKDYYWNEFKVLLEKDTYVRIGYRKTDYVTEDWLALSEWQVIFNDAYTEEAQVDFAATEYETETAELEQWEEKFSTSTFDGFDKAFTKAISDKINDDRMTAEMTFSQVEGQELLDFIKDLKQKNLDYEELYQYLGHLSFVLAKSKTLMENTNYPGKAAFQSAYNNILSKINGCSTADFEETTPYDFCMKYFNELADARGDYLDTQKADENGAKDFSAVINHPWFVNDQYEPTQNEDGEWTIKEETWQNAVGGGDANYSDKLKYTENEEEKTRTDIASDVSIVLNDENVKNQWFQRIRYEGKTNGLYMYYDDRGLIGAADTWHASKFTSGSMDVCQNIVGLPSGYYSLKALVRGWGEGNGNFHNVFMENTDGDVMKSPMATADDSGWQEVTTGIIHVSDRQLLIGGQSDYQAHYTGFRLLFYGEEPPVENLLKQEIAEVKTAAEALTFEGDKTTVNALIDKCKEPFTIENFDEYRGYLDEARKYTNAAVKEYNNLKAIDTYTTIANSYQAPGVAEIIAPAQEAAISLGDGANDTYKDIDPANKLADKYNDYIKVYVEAGSFNDASINATLAEQKTVLAAGVSTIETLEKYMASLNTPMNIDRMKDLGAENATEAAPVDITSMLVNPNFDMHQVDGNWVEILKVNGETWERGYADGWQGLGINTYDQTMQLSRGHCELWNSGTGEFYQELVGLPAGKYRISCLAVYRDADITEESVAAFEANGESHNAEIYAKTQSSEASEYIKAQASLKGDADSFTEVVRGYEIDEETNKPYVTNVTVLGDEENTEKYGQLVTDLEGWTHVAVDAEDRSPFDKIINGSYYPNSLYGIYQWFVKSPEKVTNTVTIEVKNGETLRLGLRKPSSVTNDCLTFDDFKLEYLTGDTFKNVATGIEEVGAEKAAQSVLYNTAGQVVDSSYKGIVITSDGKKFIQK
ncbi:MAG: hypothetical protein SPK34_08065 [Bacteroidaceae bacterium]|nr:hypothetical protein [Prevotellaceae bacterium]MDY5760871.1 hypothetical protein [Bacteroidaceae bacterium]